MQQIDYGYVRLKDKRQAIWPKFSPDSLALRTHRCISWLGRAERTATNDGDDHDAIFIFLWIAFNAAYGKDILIETPKNKKYENARSQFAEYFSQLVRLDRKSRIANAIWSQFSDSIRDFINNQFVFSPFWKHHNGEDGYADWEDTLKKERKDFKKALDRGDTAEGLSFLFDRLYNLRNQIMHGGATWKSQANRTQVQDGTKILAFLVPIFIEIMMDNPDEDWGKPYYPVVSG